LNNRYVEDRLKSLTLRQMKSSFKKALFERIRLEAFIQACRDPGPLLLTHLHLASGAGFSPCQALAYATIAHHPDRKSPSMCAEARTGGET